MLARLAFASRVFAAVALCLVPSQCSSTGTDHHASAQTAQTAETAQAGEVDAASGVQILVDEAPGNRKGILFTVRSDLDKVVKISFPDGSDELELAKRVPGTATFVYDTSNRQTILQTNNGTTTKGPRVVRAGGSYNPVLPLGEPRKQAVREVPGWNRMLVHCKNYGVEFSFLLSIQK